MVVGNITAHVNRYVYIVHVNFRKLFHRPVEFRGPMPRVWRAPKGRWRNGSEWPLGGRLHYLMLVTETTRLALPVGSSGCSGCVLRCK